MHTTEGRPLSQRQQDARTFLSSRLDPSLTENIGGNAPVEVKEMPVKWLAVFRGRGNGFAHSVAERVRVTEVSFVPTVDDPKKNEGKVVCEVEVTPDMCNEKGILHQGCIVFLIDECSTLSMVVANAGEGRVTPPGVSQTINSFFHGTALVGSTLRIINRSLSTELQSNAGRTEIWDVQNHRIIASGSQMTMPPSVPSTWMR